MRFISLFGDGVVPFILTPLAAYFVGKKDKRYGWFLLITVILGVLAKEYLESLVQADRPEAFGCAVLTPFSDGYSFPSGHVTYYVIFFGLLIYFAWQYQKEIWAQRLLLASTLLLAFIGYSRYYLGAHWIADITGGYIFGGLFLFLAFKTYKFYLEKARVYVYDKQGYKQGAGAVVTRTNEKGDKEVLLLYREEQNDYSFPKGAVIPGEEFEKAAIREVMEETGYKIKVVKTLSAIKYPFPDGKGKVKVNMFLATVIKKVVKKEKKEHPLWVSFKETDKKLTYPNLKKYWLKLKGKIK